MNRCFNELEDCTTVLNGLVEIDFGGLLGGVSIDGDGKVWAGTLPENSEDDRRKTFRDAETVRLLSDVSLQPLHRMMVSGLGSPYGRQDELD